MQGLAEVGILVAVLAVFAGVFTLGGRARHGRGGGCCAESPAVSREATAQADGTSDHSSQEASDARSACCR